MQETNRPYEPIPQVPSDGKPFQPLSEALHKLQASLNLNPFNLNPWDNDKIKGGFDTINEKIGLLNGYKHEKTYRELRVNSPVPVKRPDSPQTTISDFDRNINTEPLIQSQDALAGQILSLLIAIDQKTKALDDETKNKIQNLSKDVAYQYDICEKAYRRSLKPDDHRSMKLYRRLFWVMGCTTLAFLAYVHPIAHVVAIFGLSVTLVDLFMKAWFARTQLNEASQMATNIMMVSLAMLVVAAAVLLYVELSPVWVMAAVITTAIIAGIDMMHILHSERERQNDVEREIKEMQSGLSDPKQTEELGLNANLTAEARAEDARANDPAEARAEDDRANDPAEDNHADDRDVAACAEDPDDTRSEGSSPNN